MDEAQREQPRERTENQPKEVLLAPSVLYLRTRPLETLRKTYQCGSRARSLIFLNETGAHLRLLEVISFLCSLSVALPSEGAWVHAQEEEEAAGE